MEKVKSWSSFDAGLIPFGDYLVLFIALKSGIFDFFRNENKVKKDVLNQTGQGFLINALISFDFIFEEGEYFVLSAELQGDENYRERWKAFVGTFEWYLGRNIDLNNYQVPEICWDHLTTLCFFLGNDFLDAMIDFCPELKNRQIHFLDLGCGKFPWAKELLDKNSSFYFTGVDSSSFVNQYVQNFILKHPEFLDRFSFHNENMMKYLREFKDEKKYNFVSLSHVIHWMTGEDIIEMFGLIKRITHNKSKVLIFDDFIDNERKIPKSSFKKKVIQNLYGFDVYDKKQVQDMAASQGFNLIKYQVLAERRVLFLFEKQ